MSVYEDAGAQWDIDPDLLRALEKQESGGKTSATSSAGAQGNMQFMPATARGVGVANTRDPAFSVPGAAKLLHDLREGPAKGDITTALRMYHGGPDPSQWGPVNAAYAPAIYANLKKIKGQSTPVDAAPSTFNPARMSEADLLAHLDKEASSAGPPPPAPSTQTAPDFASMTPEQIQEHLNKEASGAPVEKAAKGDVPVTGRDFIKQIQTPGSQFYPGLTPEEGTAFRAGWQNSQRGIGIGINRVIGDPLSMLPGQIANRDAFNAQYGDNGAAQLGSMAGSTAATLPIMAAVNPLVSRGVGAGVDALGSVAPRLAAGLSAATDFLGGAAPGGVPMQMASRGAQGAIQGGEAALINSGQSNEPVASQVLGGAETGGLIGAATPALGAAGRTLSGASSRVDPAVAEIAQLARDRYGIQLSAPQLGLSPALAYANNALKMVPGSGVGAHEDAARGQWIRAVTRTFGEDAPRITPDVLTRAQRRIGGVMNRIEGSTNVGLDTQFMNDAAQIENNARMTLPDSEFGVVRRQLDNVLTNLQPGDTISGTTYGNLIHKGSPLDGALRSPDANIRNYATQIRDALRDSLGRSLTSDDAAAYREARTQYKNLMTVRPLTLRADATGGAMPSTGDISPAALRAAVNRSYGEGVAMEPPGGVPLHDLARVGQLMKEPPSSGSAERGSMMYALAHGAKLAGAAAVGGGGAAVAGLPAAAAGLGAGILGARAGGWYLNHPALANRMIDSTLNPLAYRTPNPMIQQYAAPLAVLAGPRRDLAAEQ